jgi:hypothetical protein
MTLWSQSSHSRTHFGGGWSEVAKNRRSKLCREPPLPIILTSSTREKKTKSDAWNQNQKRETYENILLKKRSEYCSYFEMKCRIEIGMQWELNYRNVSFRKTVQLSVLTPTKQITTESCFLSQ